MATKRHTTSQLGEFKPFTDIQSKTLWPIIQKLSGDEYRRSPKTHPEYPRRTEKLINWQLEKGQNKIQPCIIYYMQKEQMILTEKYYGIDSEISDKIVIVWQKYSM